MLFLVKPTFLSVSNINYVTINSVETMEHTEIGTVLDQSELNDIIIQIFKHKFPNPKIIFKRLKETDFYTISVENPSDIDLDKLKITISINPIFISYNDNTTSQESDIGINIIQFKMNEKRVIYTPLTDKELYENKRAKLKDIIQKGINLNGLILNNLNLNNTNYNGAKFSGSEMNGSTFDDAVLIGADFTDLDVTMKTSFNNTDLRFADFSVATVKGKSSFVGANCKFAIFIGADLTGADLSDADFRHANLTGATLTDCIINENTKFYGAILDDATYDENFVEADREFNDASDIEYEEYRRQSQMDQDQDQDQDEDEEEEEEEWEQELQDDTEDEAEVDAEADEAEVPEVEDDETIEDTATEGDKDVCFDYIFNEDKKIVKYLQKNPLNIVIKKINGEFECESLNSLRKQYKNERSGKYKYYGYYECSKELMDKVKETGTTPMAFGINDYDSTKEYVKIGSSLSYIEKPEWMYAGPPEEPRIFQLVPTGVKKYLVEKSLTKKRADLLSGVHCDTTDYFEIYKLVPIQLESNMSGGKNARRKYKKTHKKTHKKTNKKLHKKTNKKTHKKTHKKRKYIKRKSIKKRKSMKRNYMK